jgi:hypothetical protein
MLPMFNTVYHLMHLVSVFLSDSKCLKLLIEQSATFGGMYNMRREATQKETQKGNISETVQRCVKQL